MIFNWNEFMHQNIGVLVDTREKFSNFLICARRRRFHAIMSGSEALVNFESIHLWNINQTDTLIINTGFNTIRAIPKDGNTWKEMSEMKDTRLVEWKIVDLNTENCDFDHFRAGLSLIKIKNHVKLTNILTKLNITAVESIADFFPICGKTELEEIKNGGTIYLGIKDNEFLTLISKEQVKLEKYSIQKIKDIYYNSGVSLGD